MDIKKEYCVVCGEVDTPLGDWLEIKTIDTNNDSVTLMWCPKHKAIAVESLKGMI
jgi:hypothetical protein